MQVLDEVLIGVLDHSVPVLVVDLHAHAALAVAAVAVARHCHHVRHSSADGAAAHSAAHFREGRREEAPAARGSLVLLRLCAQLRVDAVVAGEDVLVALQQLHHVRHQQALPVLLLQHVRQDLVELDVQPVQRAQLHLPRVDAVLPPEAQSSALRPLAALATPRLRRMLRFWSVRSTRTALGRCATSRRASVVFVHDVPDRVVELGGLDVHVDDAAQARVLALLAAARHLQRLHLCKDTAARTRMNKERYFETQQAHLTPGY